MLNHPGTLPRLAALAALGAFAACSGCAAPSIEESLARFEPSPPEVVAAMLDAAGVTRQDTVYDLGCGDGRILVEAARTRGARGVGVDLDPELLRIAEANARAAGVEASLKFRQDDALRTEIAGANVVALFLSRRGNDLLANRLRTELRPGTRVVSHCHLISGWEPEKVTRVTAGGREHTVYVWVVQGDAGPASLGPFVPTPLVIVRRMLEVARVQPGDVVYDLGCGDGRIVVEAAKLGARAVGIEFDARLCQEARDRAVREGVAKRVEIRHEDIFAADFSDATVVTLFLLPASNEALRPRLEKLRKGARIVAHDFPIGDWQPQHREEYWLNQVEKHLIFLWRVGE